MSDGSEVGTMQIPPGIAVGTGVIMAIFMFTGTLHTVQSVQAGDIVGVGVGGVIAFGSFIGMSMTYGLYKGVDFDAA